MVAESSRGSKVADGIKKNRGYSIAKKNFFCEKLLKYSKKHR